MKNMILRIILILEISVISVFSHGTEKHDEKKDVPLEKIEVLKNIHTDSIVNQEAPNEKNIILEKKYKDINEDYLKNIKPIFQAKCFNCHSNKVTYPFYYKIPGVKNMIDKDIKEAKKHIDFSNDFPFISHETPMNDIKSLQKIAQEGGMPPLKYILGHWDSKLSDKDNEELLEWTKKAIEVLRK